MTMLNKEQILQQIKWLASQNALKKQEMLAAYEEGCLVQQQVVAPQTAILPEKELEKSNMAAVLCNVGGGIVLFGIVILLGQKWETLSSLTKISVTLGSGIAAYYTGLLFSRNQTMGAVSSAFFLISALAMWLGLNVVFDMAKYDVKTYGLQSLISTLLFGMYYGSYFLFKRNIFILFSVIFATIFFFNFNYYLASQSFLLLRDLFHYLAFVTGISYLLLGYYFAQNQQNRLLWFFYGFGIVCLLGSALILGGWKPEQRLFWELIFPVLALGSLLLSVHLKSKALLSFGALFLISYLLKITHEYFSDSLGWSFSLVISGLSVIAVGYLFFRLKKIMLY